MNIGGCISCLDVEVYYEHQRVHFDCKDVETHSVHE